MGSRRKARATAGDPPPRDERLDAALDLVALEQADRIVAAGQAGDEGLEALEALLVQAAQLVHRLLVVVDAEVEARVVLVAVDAQRRRLYGKSLERLQPFIACLPGRHDPVGLLQRDEIERRVAAFVAECQGGRGGPGLAS